MEDERIIELYWQRSEDAISETESKYGAYCRTIAHNICGTSHDAEECVNDTWFRAWNLMPPERPAYLSAFLGGITRNYSINRVKAKNRLKRGGGETALVLDELSECIPGGTEPEQCLEMKELEGAIKSFVSALSDGEKKVFILRYWYLAPISSIAEKMHFSQSKVKNILFRTRSKLSRYLQEEGLCWIR